MIFLFYSPFKEAHVNQVRRVLQKLKENGLFIKGEKCEFHVSTISFLGYVISTNGAAMNNNKVKAERE